MYVARKMDVASVLKKKSCFLFGPCQSGKSSLIRETLKDAYVFDLLSGDTFARIARNPGYIEEVCRDARPVIIDEIQKMPAILDEIHRLIETKGVKFLLTGSSARKLRKGGVNLLGGRARVRHLHPFSAAELGSGFDLNRAINYGLIPSIWFSDDPDEDLAGYVTLYLEQEILQEGATRNLPAFSRFLEIAALSSGEQINYQSIASDARIPRSTVQEYFKILKDTLIAMEVPVWRKGLSRKTVATAKFYLFDTGVARRLQRRKPLTPGTPEYGHAFENWILHEITAYADTYRRDTEITYWRTRTNLEVDFIVNGEVAIETKTTRSATKNDLKGLRAIGDEGKFLRRILVCGERRAREVDGISILPWREFIDALWSERIF
ncbi:MAG: ATP-binding protein [Kiritimatiellae bacterium]|nr:ATP-binding protein [Kiritimatiellia bacterium]